MYIICFQKTISGYFHYLFTFPSQYLYTNNHPYTFSADDGSPFFQLYNT